MKKRFLFAAFAVMMITRPFAQEAVVPAGNYHEGNDLSISWTLGELAIETLVAGDWILTQGFQQPGLIIVSVEDLYDTDLDITAYPNPTADYLNIEIRHAGPEDFSFRVYDSMGRLVGSDSFSGAEHSFNFDPFDPGLYVVTIYRDKQPVRTFRIVKR